MSTNEKQPRHFHFKVIAGSLKGRRITAPDLGITRPPLSRIRRSVFDFLNPYLVGATYLDLFSGTGSYLFEAISRGASKAVGVEQDLRLAESINRQADDFGVGDRLICRQEDVFEAIRQMHDGGARFSLIMMAPPQYKGLIDETLQALREQPLSTQSGLILCQHDTSEKRIDFGAFPIEQTRRYGNTTFTILRPL